MRRYTAFEITLLTNAKYQEWIKCRKKIFLLLIVIFHFNNQLLKSKFEGQTSVLSLTQSKPSKINVPWNNWDSDFSYLLILGLWIWYINLYPCILLWENVLNAALLSVDILINWIQEVTNFQEEGKCTGYRKYRLCCSLRLVCCATLALILLFHTSFFPWHVHNIL